MSDMLQLVVEIRNIVPKLDDKLKHVEHYFYISPIDQFCLSNRGVSK